MGEVPDLYWAELYRAKDKKIMSRNEKQRKLYRVSKCNVTD